MTVEKSAEVGNVMVEMVEMVVETVEGRFRRLFNTNKARTSLMCDRRLISLLYSDGTHLHRRLGSSHRIRYRARRRST